MRQSAICTCGHSLLVHLKACQMKNCKCKDFIHRDTGKGQFDREDLEDKENKS